MSTSQRAKALGATRAVLGAVLFIAWAAETIIWIASTVHLANAGKTMAVVTSVGTLALLVLLAGMEGLEVSVIDRWREVFPSGNSSDLARWLSARQLFVALIVTSATLLARRSVLVVPFTSARATGGTLAGVFDLTWTGFTVLWFAQIVPKALAATNPDGYLRLLRRPLFPLVAVVRAIGITLPGEWAASAASRLTGWSAAQSDTALAWSSLTSEEGPATRTDEAGNTGVPAERSEPGGARPDNETN